MTVNQISVFLENKPGQLAEMTRVLSANGIDLRALSIADTKDYGIARLMVDDPYKTALVLKEAGWVSTMTPVLAVHMPDRPGALEEILNVLAEGRITLEYVYAFLTHKTNTACLVLRVEDNDGAVKLLREHGIALVSQDEFSKI